MTGSERECQRRIRRIGPLQCDDPVGQSRLAGVADPVRVEVLEHRAADGPGGEQLPRFQRFREQRSTVLACPMPPPVL